jgi:hypothetical protein
MIIGLQQYQVRTRYLQPFRIAFARRLATKEEKATKFKKHSCAYSTLSPLFVDAEHRRGDDNAGSTKGFAPFRQPVKTPANGLAIGR